MIGDHRAHGPVRQLSASELERRLPDRTLMRIAMRQEDMKYSGSLECEPDEPMDLEQLQREELDARSDDPWEPDDLSERDAASRDAFRARLSRYLTTVCAARSVLGARRELDEGLMRRLVSLGHVAR